MNVYSEPPLVVIYTKLCALQSGLVWALLGVLCTLGLGILLQPLGDCIRSGITGALGYKVYSGVLGYFIGLLGIVFTAEFGFLWLVSVLWGFGLLHPLVGNCIHSRIWTPVVSKCTLGFWATSLACWELYSQQNLDSCG